MTKEKFGKIVGRYTLQNYAGFISDSDEINSAIEFVWDMLCAEADYLEETEPYATKSIDRLKSAAHEVFMMLNEYDEIFEEVFG